MSFSGLPCGGDHLIREKEAGPVFPAIPTMEAGIEKPRSGSCETSLQMKLWRYPAASFPVLWDSQVAWRARGPLPIGGKQSVADGIFLLVFRGQFPGCLSEFSRIESAPGRPRWGPPSSNELGGDMIDTSQRALYFAGFVSALTVYVVAMKVGERVGIPHANLIATLFICILLTVLFPERRPGLGWGRRGVTWVAAIAFMLCAIWTFCIWAWNEHSANIVWDRNIPVFVFFLVVATPWFEEKLLRHLLLTSVMKILGASLSVLVVSLLFAIAHKGMFLWSFLCSSVFCWMRIQLNAKTSHCTVVHGTVNAYVLMLYLL